jgi:hypothetical protein
MIFPKCSIGSVPGTLDFYFCGQWRKVLEMSKGKTGSRRLRTLFRVRRHLSDLLRLFESMSGQEKLNADQK